MACCTVALQEQQKKSVLWLWKLSTPLVDSSVPEWTAYTDVENEIIEEAYQQNKSEVILDDFHINFKRLFQISNTNKVEQQHVKRITRDGNEKKVRENRFLPISISSLKAFADDGSTFDYVDKVEENFKSFYCFDEELSRLKFIEAAAHGLLIEGKRAGKEREGEWMAQQLFNVKEGTAEELYPVCARLYSMNSFLYRKMNELMRLITDYTADSKTVVDDSISTFGPFIYLLASFYPPNGNSCKTVYRGALLSDNMIDQFQQACITKQIQSFPAFTSASRNRDVAEMYAGNVLFEIDIDWEGSDISPYSNFPDEEEIPQLNQSIYQIDHWKVFCPSNFHYYYLDNQQTRNHQSIIFGLRELNSSQTEICCSNNNSPTNPPITNDKFHFTSNYQLRVYSSGCYFLDKNNQWNDQGLRVGPLTNHNQTHCLTLFNST